MTPTSRVAQAVEITGTMKFKGELLFEGRFDGDSIEGDDLVIGEHAQIRAATVRVINFTSAGLVEGNVEVSERAALKGTAHLRTTLRRPSPAGTCSGCPGYGLSVHKPPTAA